MRHGRIQLHSTIHRGNNHRHMHKLLQKCLAYLLDTDLKFIILYHIFRELDIPIHRWHLFAVYIFDCQQEGVDGSDQVEVEMFIIVKEGFAVCSESNIYLLLFIIK